MGRDEPYRVVLVSPSDVQAERNTLPAIIDEINRGIARELGVRFELWRWETDVAPGFHPLGPQGLIDAKLQIEDCDVLIGIFWRRFGTVAIDGRTGTEHELNLAVEAWKKSGTPRIMAYFCSRKHSPRSPTEAEQWSKVLSFKDAF